MDLRNHPDDIKLKAIISHPGCLATTLHSIFYRTFGEEIYGWSSETLDLEAEDQFGVRMPPENLDKLDALISSLQSEVFYQDWSAFTGVCQVLCGSDDPFSLSDPLMVAEMAWGVLEVQLNDSTPGVWSDEVKRYVGLILHEEGFVSPPGVLRFADMPEVYRGSDSPADMSQEKQADTAHKAVVEQYIEEQSLLLFKQLRALPWMTDDQLEKLMGELQV